MAETCDSAGRHMGAAVAIANRGQLILTPSHAQRGAMPVAEQNPKPQQVTLFYLLGNPKRASAFRIGMGGF